MCVGALADDTLVAFAAIVTALFVALFVALVALRLIRGVAAAGTKMALQSCRSGLLMASRPWVTTLNSAKVPQPTVTAAADVASAR